LGPTPSTLVSSAISTGISARLSSNCSKVPVSTAFKTFSEMDSPTS
jgi:hypothetical protein